MKKKENTAGGFTIFDGGGKNKEHTNREMEVSAILEAD